MYADAAPAPEAATPPQQEPKEAKPDDEGEGGQTAEIPKAVLGGKDFKPGEEVMLEVVQVNEDSVLVKYASDKGSEGEGGGGEGEEGAAPPPASGPMSSMME